MSATSTYQRRIEALFREAEALFERIRSGEECDGIILDAIALNARFDDAGEDLLQGLYKEVEVKIDKARTQDKKKGIAVYYYERFLWKGIVFGPQYWRVDRMARVCYRNYTGGAGEIFSGMLTKRDCLLDTMRDVHDWMYHYAESISGWWSMGDLGNLYTPKGEAQTPEGEAKFIKEYLTKDISARTYSTLLHVLRPDAPRPLYEWEAIARIIYDCPYFKKTRTRTRRTYEKGKAVSISPRKKAWTFNEWCVEFTRLVGIPIFTQRSGHKQVSDAVERLKRLSGKDGGLKFLLKKPNKKRP
jgi:hypothetical protein